MNCMLLGITGWRKKIWLAGWLAGCLPAWLALKISGSQDLRISRYQDLKLSGSQGHKMSRSLDLQISRSLDFRIWGSQALKISRSQHPRISGSQDLRISRSQDPGQGHQTLSKPQVFQRKINGLEVQAKILGSGILARDTKPFQNHRFLKGNQWFWSPGQDPGIQDPGQGYQTLSKPLAFLREINGFNVLAKILGSRILPGPRSTFLRDLGLCDLLD